MLFVWFAIWLFLFSIWSLPSFFVVLYCRLVLLYPSTQWPMYASMPTLWRFIVGSCSWSYLLICIGLVKHDVNIATKKCFSCTNSVCYLSTHSSYRKIQCRELIQEWPGWLVVSCTESFDQGCLVGAASQQKGNCYLDSTFRLHLCE